MFVFCKAGFLLEPAFLFDNAALNRYCFLQNMENAGRTAGVRNEK